MKVRKYIYIRNHPSYENTCKLGKPQILSIEISELRRGYFEPLYEITSDCELNYLENILKEYFSKYNIKYDGSTEFFEKTIIELLEPYFKLMI